MSDDFCNFSLRPSTCKDLGLSQVEDAIKERIGSKVIDETLQLHDEVVLHYEIWREEVERNKGSFRDKELAEAPLIRENLYRQIEMLTDLLDDKLKRTSNRGVSAVLTREDVTILEDIKQDKKRESEKRKTLCSSLKETEPLNIGSDEDLLGSIPQIRERLLEEREALLLDIQYIQDCLIKESDSRLQPKTARTPTISDLKKLCRKLEQSVLNNSTNKPSSATFHHHLTNPPNHTPTPPSSSRTSPSRRPRIMTSSPVTSSAPTVIATSTAGGQNNAPVFTMS